MSILFKYILKRILGATLVITPVVASVIWLAVSFRFISVIVSKDIDLKTYFSMISLIIPDVAGIVLPICFLLACIFVFAKLTSDKELVVLRSVGVSNNFIVQPFLIVSLLVSMTVFMLQAVISPISYKNLNDLQYKIQNQISMSVIKPGVFNVIGKTVVYLGKKESNSISDVFISYASKNNNVTHIITAQHGAYSIDDDHLFINLKDGYRQTIDHSKDETSTLKFETFSYDVTQFIKDFSPKKLRLTEKSQKELFDLAKLSKSLEQKRKYLSEAFGRSLLPLIPIINALLVCFFMMGRVHRKTIINVIQAFSCGMIIHISFLVLINLSSRIYEVIFLNYIFAVCIIFALLLKTIAPK